MFGELPLPEGLINKSPLCPYLGWWANIFISCIVSKQVRMAGLLVELLLSTLGALILVRMPQCHGEIICHMQCIGGTTAVPTYKYLLSFNPYLIKVSQEPLYDRDFFGSEAAM